MKNKPKPVSVPSPSKPTAEDFTRRYNELCREMGFQIAFEPRWRQSQEPPYDYRLIIVPGIAPFVENNNG